MERFFKLKERGTTVTTFSEVNAGVAAGGRTGLTAVFCGIFFFIAMLLLTH